MKARLQREELDLSIYASIDNIYSRRAGGGGGGGGRRKKGRKKKGGGGGGHEW